MYETLCQLLFHHLSSCYLHAIRIKSSNNILSYIMNSLKQVIDVLNIDSILNRFADQIPESSETQF